MKDTDAAWLAGFLEGEGTFQIVRYVVRGTKGYPSGAKKYSGFAPQISASNCNRDVLEKCKAIAGGCIFVVRPRGWNRKWKQPLRWVAKGTSLDWILAALIPHLVSKREQAEILLALRNRTRRGAAPGRQGLRDEAALRHHMKLAINCLNSRGTDEPKYRKSLDHVRDVLALAKQELLSDTA